MSYQTRNDELQSSFAGSLLNGIFIAVVCSTLYTSVSKNGWNSLLRPMIVSMLAMYVLSTVNLAVHLDIIKSAFVNHGQTEGTVLTALNEVSILDSALSDISLFMNMAIADGILIWRCWVIWNRNWKIVLMPVLFVMAELASGLFMVVIDFKNPTNFGAPYNAMTLVNPVTSLISTLLTTALITSRILSTCRPLKYWAATEILVESAALYSLALIFYIGFSRSSLPSEVTMVILSQVTGLAPALIVARVACGLARPDSSWSEPEPVSALRFESGALSRITGQSVHDIEAFGPDREVMFVSAHKEI